jgi:WD40 repeat protein
LASQAPHPTNASTTQGLVCPRCASPAKPGKKFCSQCGSPIDGRISSPPARFPRRSNLCHECGFENHHSDRFCKSCGGLLTFSPGDPSGDWTEETAAAPPPIDGPVDTKAEGSPSPSLEHSFSPVASAESAPAPVGAESRSAPVNESAPQLKPADLQAVKSNWLDPRTILVSVLGIGVVAGFVLFFMHRCGGAQSKQVSPASKAVVAVTAPSGAALPPVTSQKNELPGLAKGTAAASGETSTTDRPQPPPKGSTRTPENVSTNVSPLNLSSSTAPRSPIAPQADSPRVIASKGDGAFPLESVPAGRSASVVPLPAIPTRVGTDALTLLSPFDAVSDASRTSSKVSPGPEAGAPADMASTLPSSTGNLEAIARARGRLADFSLVRTLGGHRGWVTAVAFSADARLLASGSWDQTVKFWDVSSGREVRTLAPQSSGIEAIAFSPNGRWLASETSDKSVGLWDAATGRELRTLSSHKSSRGQESLDYSLAFSPDGRRLAWGTDGKTVGLWDVEEGREIRQFSSSRRGVVYVAFSPNGQRLALGEDKKTIGIWDATTGREVQTLSGHTKEVYAVAFSPDSRWLASASEDRTLKLWDVTTGSEIRTFTGHAARVTSVAFSPDGRLLASAGWDKTIRLWDVATGRCLEVLQGHVRPVYAIAFSPDGRWLASGSEDQTVKLWVRPEVILASGKPSKP